MTAVLVIEDDGVIARAMGAHLRTSGFDVEWADDGTKGLRKLRFERPDVCVVDLMLPGLDGWGLIERARDEGLMTPILAVSARGNEHDKVATLALGADDYLAKPFALPELLARVRALLRRGRTAGDLRLTVSDLELDLIARRASRGGRLLDLTNRELDLLEYLMRHRGHAVSREMLARDVWREPNRGSSLDNVIDVQMGRLRRKVDEEGNDRLIQTVRGVGFVLREVT